MQTLGLLSREIAESCLAIARRFAAFAKVSACRHYETSAKPGPGIRYSRGICDCSDRPQITGYPACAEI